MSFNGYIDQFHGDENECNGHCGFCSDCDESFYMACDEYYYEYDVEYVFN